MRHPTVAGLVLLVCSLAPLAAETSRIALVIGNGAYSDSVEPLANPTNDAVDVAGKLEANGWKVLLVKDADRREMIRKLADFRDALKATSKPTALFFYAGHAVQIEGRNYLLPVNEKFEDKTDVVESAFLVDRVKDALDEVRVAQSVIFLDACRDDPFKNKTRSLGASRGLAAVPVQENAEEGSAVIFSTAQNDVASDGQGRNGLFTEALLPYLDSDLELTALFKKVRDDVRKKSGGTQTPSIVTSGILIGMYLGKTNVSLVTTTAPRAGQVTPTLKIRVGELQAGLTVFIDGKAVGTTPLTAEVAQGEQHLVSLQSNEWKTWNSTVSATTTGTITLDPKLVRSKAGQVIDVKLRRQTLIDQLGLKEEASALWGTVGKVSWIGAGVGVLTAVVGYFYGSTLRPAYDAATPDTVGAVKAQLANATLLYQAGIVVGGTGTLAGLTSFLLKPDVAGMQRRIQADESLIQLLEASQ